MIDGRIVGPRMTGAGRYVVEVSRRVPAVDTNLRLTVLLRSVLRTTSIPELLADSGANVQYCDVPVATFRQWFTLPRVAHAFKPDLYHYPFLDLPWIGSPSVVTIYDLNPILAPNYFARQRRLRRLAARWLVTSTLRRCRLAMVISETVRRLVAETFPSKAHKLRVVRLGTGFTDIGGEAIEEGRENPRVSDPRWGERPYVLYVGVDRPHKNLARLVRGFVLFYEAGRWSAGQEPYLWLAGVGDGSPELQTILRQSEYATRIRLSAALSDDSLRSLYRGARAAACVSTSEGFGLPLLEAFAAGVPVVSGNASSLPEIAGDAAMFVSPWDEGDIARGLRAVWEDASLRDSLIKRGLSRAREFSWDSTAVATVETYLEAIRRPPTRGL